MCFDATLSIHPTLSFPSPCPQVCSYVCVSIAALQIRSSVSDRECIRYVHQICSTYSSAVTIRYLFFSFVNLQAVFQTLPWSSPEIFIQFILSHACLWETAIPPLVKSFTMCPLIWWEKTYLSIIILKIES